MQRLAVALIVVLLAHAPAASLAAPRVLRMASVAPEGTQWAHEINAFAREVEATTEGAVRIKMYLGGIAGGEDEMFQRVRLGQLDGVISGGMFCSRAAPSLRVFRMLGLVRTRREAVYVINRLHPLLSREFEANGFVELGIALVGMDLLFSRGPVRSMAELRRGAYWIWDADDMVQKQLTAMGVKLLPAPLPSAGAAYENRRVDGFLTVPGAALAFQWSALARYAQPLDYTALPGCAIITQRAFDELPFEARQALRGAGAKLQARFDDVTATQDAALLGGLFARQGLLTTPISERFRAEFYDAAGEVIRKLGTQLVPAELLREVTRILTEYRAQR